jgi:hypothetical protein
MIAGSVRDSLRRDGASEERTFMVPPAFLGKAILTVRRERSQSGSLTVSETAVKTGIGVIDTAPGQHGSCATDSAQIAPVPQLSE